MPLSFCSLQPAYSLLRLAAAAATVATAALSAPAFSSGAGAPAPLRTELLGSSQGWGSCATVHDSVMGGVSSGSAAPTASGGLLFRGSLSTEHNGGFASVRCSLQPAQRAVLQQQQAAAAKFFVVALQGDGRAYTLRVSTAAAEEASAPAYQASLPTMAGQQSIVRIEAAAMRAKWRGRPMEAPALRVQDAQSIGLIALAKERGAGGFACEVLWVAVE
jgi:NADH dehydrogenase [ubiquinone] 1 alpha subcomplex assembly factor 1